MRVSSIFLAFILGCDSEQTAKIINDAPSVLITSHSDGFEVFEGEILQFRAQASDTNDGTQEITVAWYLEQELVCDWTTPMLAGDSYCDISFEGENAIVVAEVRDQVGAAGRAEVFGSLIPNEAPTLEIVSPNETDRYYSDQLISFQIAVSDLEDTPEDLIVTWESSLAGELALEATPDANGSIDDAGYLPEGQHFLEIRVTDTMGKSVAQSLVLDVGGENTAPSCQIIEPENHAAYSLGETIFFTAQLQDTEASAEELSFTWISDKDGPLGTGSISSSGEVYLSTSTLSANTHTITFSGTDEIGESCADIIFLTVGTAPTIIINAPTNGNSYRTGESISFSATIADNDELPSNLSIAWVSDIDGELNTQSSDSNGNLNFTRNNLSAGNHSITLTVTDSSGLLTTSTFNLLVNTVPTAPTLSLSPSTAQTGDNLLVSATGATDADGDSVNYAYLWLQNGVLTSNATLSVNSSLTAKGDIWTARVTPNDGHHNGPYSEISIIIENTTPVIASTTISPASPLSYDLLTCSVLSTDQDGEALSTVYSWSNVTTGQTLGSNTTLQLNPSTTSAGDVIKCEVSVSDSDTTVTSFALETIANTPPVLSSVSILGTPEIGETLTCSALATDSDGDTLNVNYNWIVSGQVLGTNTSITLDSSWIAPMETIECSATITDTSGASASSSSSLQLQNQSPTITSVSLSLATVNHQGTIECLALASDEDNETPTLTYSWENLTTGTTIGASSNLTLTPNTATSQDVIQCRVTATDGYGGSDVDTISFTVENTAPYFTSAALITPNTGVSTTSTINCSGVAQDTDGALPTLTYSWENQSTGTTIGSAPSISLNTVITSPTDIISCTITATDVDGEKETSTALIALENSAPSIDLISITPNNPHSSAQLTCQVNWSDADGEALSPSYVWSNLNTGVQLGTTASITLAPTLVQPEDTLSCSVFLSDNYGASVSDSTTVDIINTAPEISLVTINSNTTPIHNDSELECIITASDPDNQSLTEIISWQNTTQGTTIGTGSVLTLDSSIASSSDTIACEALVIDTSGDFDISSTSVTLNNRIPDMPVLSISPSPAYIDSTLTCSITSQTDPDDDPLTPSYSWMINGSPVQGNTTETLVGGFVAGNAIQCEVITNDGTLNSTVGFASINIANRPPIVNSVIISPDPAYVANGLTATATGSDVDGDSLNFEYTWSVEGSQVQAGTSNTLAAGSFIKNETVSVSVRAFDLFDYSSPLVESLMISNTAPSAPTISLTPSNPVEGSDNLVCTVTGVSFDADFDSVSYSFSWTVDGTPYILASTNPSTSTVLASETTAGEEWICTVTPNDNDDDGTTGSSAVTIDSDWAGMLEFSTCGKDGLYGPVQSQCDSIYAGTTLDGLVTVTNGFQYWTVPATGIYEITVNGAQGGDGAVSPNYHGGGGLGGLGAEMRGEFALTAGEVLAIVVGQQGEAGIGNGNCGGGGGGGSFVWRDSNTELLIAAGGGGGGPGTSWSQDATIHGRTSTTGQTPPSKTDYNYYAGAGGTAGAGGGAGSSGGSTSCGYCGAGGAGWLSDGGAGGAYGDNHGKTRVNGFIGGRAPNNDSNGGFGGGAATGDDGRNNYSHGNAGGGGYSGGGGMGYPNHGGGGGSYNGGSNQNNSTGINTGHGSVTIDKL